MALKVHFDQHTAVTKNPLNVYMAGKIAKNDWRHGIVGGALLTVEPFKKTHLPIPGTRWNYVGPFFVSCDHGCNHGPNAHGVNAGSVNSTCSGDDGTYRDSVVRACIEGIKRADAVFAWIDSVTAYGTIAELGYAKALDKPIAAFVQEDFNSRDIWFVKAMTNARPVSTVDKAWAIFQRRM